MPSKIPLSLACGDYEITRPLQEGSVARRVQDLSLDGQSMTWTTLRLSGSTTAMPSRMSTKR